MNIVKIDEKKEKENSNNNNNNNEKSKAEDIKESKIKYKKKADKGFFLYTVNKSNKKKDKINKNTPKIIIDTKDENISSINNKNISSEENNINNKAIQINEDTNKKI